MSIGNIKDYTPNYKFIIPKFDTATWHDYIESNFRSIDALLYNIFVVNGYKGEWTNSTLYEVGSVIFIGDNNGDFTGKLFKVLVEHTTPNSGNFETFYENNPDKYEQFADFDAAERAAQLAKDWANKLGGTVDGLEYSAKYYAQLAQQTLTSKANDNEVVHLTGTETINGNKTFVDNLVKQSNSLEYKGIYIQNTQITKGTAPNTNVGGQFVFQDKDGLSLVDRIGGVEVTYDSSGNIKTQLIACQPSATSVMYDSISIAYPTNGNAYTSAPTPTDTTTTSGKQIATTGWVNSTNNNVVHKTGNETIAGIKTFAESYNVKNNAVKGTAPSADDVRQLQFCDKNGSIIGTVFNTYATDKRNTVGFAVNKVNSASDTDRAFLFAVYPPSGSPYTWCLPSDVNGSIVTTVNKSKAANGYFQLGNGLIIQWGTKTDNGNVTFPKAFTTHVSVSLSVNNGIPNYNNITKTGFTANSYGASATPVFTWIAIGY